MYTCTYVYIRVYIYQTYVLRVRLLRVVRAWCGFLWVSEQACPHCLPSFSRVSRPISSYLTRLPRVCEPSPAALDPSVWVSCFPWSFYRSHAHFSFCPSLALSISLSSPLADLFDPATVLCGVALSRTRAATAARPRIYVP